jgi:hypothetical protein
MHSYRETQALSRWRTNNKLYLIILLYQIVKYYLFAFYRVSHCSWRRFVTKLIKARFYFWHHYKISTEPATLKRPLDHEIQVTNVGAHFQRYEH